MSNPSRTAIPILCALLLLGLAGTGLWAATAWVGKPFPGFLLLGNRVVASASLPAWPATRGGEIFQHEVVSIDGVPLGSAEQLLGTIRSEPAGTPFRYRFRSGGREFERSIPTRRFGALDFTLLFGVYLLNGLVLGGCALALLVWRGGSPGVRAAVPLLGVGALWGLRAMDLYGPYRLFRLHALGESLLFATALHTALHFPRSLGIARSLPALAPLAYASALGLAVWYQVGLYDPGAYVALHLVATCLLGAALFALLVAQVARYLSRSSPEGQLQLAILAWGGLIALSPLVGLTLCEPLTGGRAAQNAVGVTAFLFALAIALAGLLGPVPRLVPEPRQR